MRAATNNVLDAFSRIEPSKIITKPKLHLLTHLPDDIRRYGPLTGEATKAFECFNAVFRFCSVLLNHQAPSCDIMIQLADQEGFKQHVTGSWWPDDSGGWKCSGLGVRSSLEHYMMLKSNLGWANNTIAPPGLLLLVLVTQPLPSSFRNITAYPVHKVTSRKTIAAKLRMEILACCHSHQCRGFLPKSQQDMVYHKGGDHP